MEHTFISLELSEFVLLVTDYALGVKSFKFKVWAAPLATQSDEDAMLYNLAIMGILGDLLSRASCSLSVSKTPVSENRRFGWQANYNCPPLTFFSQNIFSAGSTRLGSSSAATCPSGCLQQQLEELVGEANGSHINAFILLHIKILWNAIVDSMIKSWDIQSTTGQVSSVQDDLKRYNTEGLSN